MMIPSPELRDEGRTVLPAGSGCTGRLVPQAYTEQCPSHPSVPLQRLSCNVLLFVTVEQLC